jgi:hypothetical protein
MIGAQAVVRPGCRPQAAPRLAPGYRVRALRAIAGTGPRRGARDMIVTGEADRSAGPEAGAAEGSRP